MKSLAVFGFIFLLAASANAGLMISVNGVIQPPSGEMVLVLQPDETAVIGIHGDGKTEPPVILYLFVEGPGSIDGHTIVYPGSLTSHEELEAVADALGLSAADALAAFRDFTGRTDLQDLSFITLGDTAIPPALLEGLLVDNIIFHCGGLGDVTLTLDWGDWFDRTVIIHQIPEPITLLLLGMGGLFAVARCRRRRQA